MGLDVAGGQDFSQMVGLIEAQQLSGAFWQACWELIQPAAPSIDHGHELNAK
jgi:hypothetical protein